MSNDLIDRTRRNHALEHASINVLSERHKGFSAQGNSAPYASTVTSAMKMSMTPSKMLTVDCWQVNRNLVFILPVAPYF